MQGAGFSLPGASFTLHPAPGTLQHLNQLFIIIALTNDNKDYLRRHSIRIVADRTYFLDSDINPDFLN